jgi:hypothetical protein
MTTINKTNSDYKNIFQAVYDGSLVEIELLDRTHARYRFIGDHETRWTWALHIQQFNEEFLKVMQDAGKIVPSNNSKLTMSYFNFGEV